jgi:hypothetical protein
MRISSLLAVSSVVLLAAPAIAQTSPQPANADTYKAIVEHGLVLVTPGADIDVKFTPDGRFVAFGGLSKGVWKIVGDKLCTTPDETLIETCAAYPAGKKSGDQFEFDSPQGRATVRIN